MRALEYPFDCDDLLLKRKKYCRILKEELKDPIKARIAILGGSTTTNIKNMLELFLLNYEIEPEFYESDYDRFYEEAVFENKALEVFKPDIIYICTCHYNITSFPQMNDSADETETRFNAEINRFRTIWDKLETTYHCPIIQNNFEMPPYRLLGNRDAYDPHGAINYLTRINLWFYEYAQRHDNFHICDLNYISADYGLEKWHDLQAYYMYKYACAVAATPYLAFNVANIIKSIYGKNKKAFVLDLDNTLWGGVVGDDGVEKISLGHETAQGEAYLAFQKYLKKHEQLGIILNVNSKNEYANAIAGINHPESVLKQDDFIVIKANWNPKDQNLKEIAEELDLTIEGLVFVDDNPAERMIVKDSFSKVAVPEISDVTEYIKIIDRSGFFEQTSYSADDANRKQMYQKNVDRKVQATQFSDYGEYLISLEMNASIKAFEPVYYERISQLTNKTNQFNLTTKRYTLSEIASISKDADHITLCGKLTDKFGDNGIVTVLIGTVRGVECHIDTWLMSCRVLKRNMEHAMLDKLVAECKKRNIEEIIGYYYPTAKNKMVQDMYAHFGFTCVVKSKDESTVWKLRVSDYQNKNEYIFVE